MPLGEDLAILRFEEPPQRGKRVHSGSVELEHSPGDRRVFRVNFNGAQQFVVSIAERRPAWINTLGCFLAHSLPHLIPQVLDVVSSDYKLNSVYEFRL